MASYCPKCNYKLSMIDVKPECPVCGVNLLYYGMEDTLKKEADKAEYEHAKFQPHVDRLKAGTIGSKLAIIRLIICILPIAALFVPMGKITVNLPFYAETTTVNIISIVTNVFMKLDFDYLFAMAKAPGVGSAYICYMGAIVCIALAVVMILVNLFNLTMACAKRGLRRNITIASLGAVFSIAAVVLFQVWCKSLNSAVPEIFSGKATAFGALALCLAFILEIAINLIYKKKNIPVKYKDVSQYLIAYDLRDKPKAEEKAAEETEEVSVEAGKE